MLSCCFWIWGKCLGSKASVLKLEDVGRQGMRAEYSQVHSCYTCSHGLVSVLLASPKDIHPKWWLQ